MGYQDRHYYRDNGSGAFNPFTWLLSGSVPLFTFAGIRVRAHASLIVTIVLVLLIGLGNEFSLQDRFQSMSMLFAIVLLHEFGHCFAARWLGGDANDIMMTPIGGLAMASPPRRPLPTFLTVSAGPAVNVIICIICGTILYLTVHILPWNPTRFVPIDNFQTWAGVIHWAYWTYSVSYMLLIFNLLPIFPLDGGQMLQAILWPKFGYVKSMNFACITGMIGAVILGGLALPGLNLFMMFIAISGFMYCMNMRRMLQSAGAEDFADGTDYSAAYETMTPRRRRGGRRAAKRALKLARAERVERQRIDAILAKVSARGMHSLTWLERRALRKATEHQRQRDLETAPSRRR